LGSALSRLFNLSTFYYLAPRRRRPSPLLFPFALFKLFALFSPSYTCSRAAPPVPLLSRSAAAGRPLFSSLSHFSNFSHFSHLLIPALAQRDLSDMSDWSEICHCEEAE